MKLRFTKMHGLGNDFVVIDGVSQALFLNPECLRRIADRHLGVGCDQILLVEKAEGDADFRYRIFNADGGEVERSGRFRTDATCRPERERAGRIRDASHRQL